MNAHLEMAQLLAVRDGDMSEPGSAQARAHVQSCALCSAELRSLEQRTARLRALPDLRPAHDVYPAVRSQLVVTRRHQVQRRVTWVGLAAAASLILALVASDLATPPALDASEQLDAAMLRSQLLELTLSEYRPEDRVIDGNTARVVVELEDRIADLDGRLARAATGASSERLGQQAELWQERVSLLSALIDVHVSRATNVDL